jgi:selenocysteine lyase/cysteine desulfurase
MILTIEFQNAAQLKARIMELQEMFGIKMEDTSPQMAFNFEEKAEETTVKQPKSKKTKKTAAAEEACGTEAGTAMPAEEAPVSSDQVKVAAHQLNTVKGIKAVADILERFNAKRVSEVKSENFAAFVEACNSELEGMAA